MLLNTALTDGNRLEIPEELKREDNQDGVINVSARNAFDAKIKGFQTAADARLAKTFHLSESARTC